MKKGNKNYLTNNVKITCEEDYEKSINELEDYVNKNNISEEDYINGLKDIEYKYNEFLLSTDNFDLFCSL